MQALFGEFEFSIAKLLQQLASFPELPTPGEPLLGIGVLPLCWGDGERNIRIPFILLVSLFHLACGCVVVVSLNVVGPL